MVSLIRKRNSVKPIYQKLTNSDQNSMRGVFVVRSMVNGFIKNILRKCKKIYSVVHSNLLQFFLYLSFFYLIFLIFNFLNNSPSIKLGQQIYLTSPKNVPVERTIDVVMGADDGYIQHSAATMASILLNCDASSNFRFHILDGGISSDKKEKLLKLKKLRDFDIQFYDMTKYDWSMFPDNRAFITLVTYYRLRIPEVLPKSIQKALYLDGDMIIEQDLKELWNTDISDYMLGAIEDVEGIDSRNRLGLSNKYFNAGVLLLNLEKIRKTDLLKDSVSYLEKNKNRIIYQDQDILNGLFNTQYKNLPLKWNVNSHMYFRTEKKHTYTDNDAKVVRTYPGIIHFTGGAIKPWNQNKLTHPLADEYWKYSKYTEFYFEKNENK